MLSEEGGFDRIEADAEWCNGSTSDSESENWGSNPCSATQYPEV